MKYQDGCYRESRRDAIVRILNESQSIPFILIMLITVMFLGLFYFVIMPEMISMAEGLIVSSSPSLSPDEVGMLTEMLHMLPTLSILILMISPIWFILRNFRV